MQRLYNQEISHIADRWPDPYAWLPGRTRDSDLNGEAALFLEEARWHTRSIKIASKPVSPVRRSASTAGMPVSA
jgi:hypothetical protein